MGNMQAYFILSSLLCCIFMQIQGNHEIDNFVYNFWALLFLGILMLCYVASTKNKHLKIRTSTSFFFLLSSLFLPNLIIAQEYTVQVQHFDEEEGMIDKEVHDIYEDREGFIWVSVGSETIQRYDGNQFEIFAVDLFPDLNTRIPSIWQDHQGWLWLYGSDGDEISFFNPRTKKVLSPKERFGEEFPIRKCTRFWRTPRFLYTPASLIENSKGQYCLLNAQPNELILYNPDNSFDVIPLKGLQNLPLILYHIGSNDNLWLNESDKANISGDTWFQINTSGQILNRINQVEDFSKIPDLSKADQELLFFYAKGHFKEKKPNVDLYFGTLNWEFSKNHWLAFDPNTPTKPLINLNPSDFYKNIFPDGRYVMEDSRGMLWVASIWGLTQVIAKPNRFENYFAFENQAEAPFNSLVKGLLIRENKLYINFKYTGLVQVDIENPNKWSFVYEPEEEYTGYSMLQLKDGSILTGHREFDFRLINQNGSIEQLHFTEKHFLQESHESLLYQDDNQILWLTTLGGLYYKLPNEDSCRFVPPNKEVTNRDYLKHGAWLGPGLDGKMWIGTFGELHHFEPDTKKFLKTFTELKRGDFQIPGRVCHQLHIDKDSVHWLGTRDGLLRWDIKSDEKRLFTLFDGLSSLFINGIFEDNHEHLWLASRRGLMQFNKKNFQVKTYLKSNGLSDDDFSSNSFAKTEDGRVYFGTSNGVTSFHPNDFHKTDPNNFPELILTSFEIFDGEAEKLLEKTAELDNTKTIRFNPSDRFFRLNFTLLTFEDVKLINYAWKVDGIHKDWNYKKENSLQIGALPYGSHTLRIKGQDGGGHWSPHELAYQIHVLRPFYLQIWFIILSILLLISIAFTFYIRRTNRFKQAQKLLESEITKATVQIASDKKMIEKQAEDLRALDKMKSRFFANVSHELRTPLTLMLAPIEAALKENKLTNFSSTNLIIAKRNGERLHKMINEILSLTKLEASELKLNISPVNWHSYLQLVVNQFESLGQLRQIDFCFKYESAPDLKIEIDKTKIEIILYNLLSNAIKFTPKGGTIKLQAKDENEFLILTVSDTGGGIPLDDLPHIFNRFYQSNQQDINAEGGTGIGLALVNEFTQLMSGTVSVKSELGKGTTFTVSIPKKEVFEPIQNETEHVLNNSNVQSKSNEVSPITLPFDPTKPTILLVEDNQDLQIFIQSLLQIEYNVVPAENGKEALERLGAPPVPKWEHPPTKSNAGNGSPLEPASTSRGAKGSVDLIISDVMMPIMNGFELLEKLKSSSEFRHIPVIMLTARIELRDKLKALRIGVDDYLTKPFVEEELLARIHNLLNNAENRVVAQPVPTLPERQTQPPLPKVDTEWLEKLEKVALSKLGNVNLLIEDIAREMELSERQFYRRIRENVGQTPNQYLKTLRLNTARKFLEEQTYDSVKVTALSVGFKDIKYFSHQFKKEFGRLPSEYI